MCSLVFAYFKKESGENVLCYTCKKISDETLKASLKECNCCKNLFIGLDKQSICNICSDKNNKCEICGKKIMPVNKKYIYKSERKLTNTLF